MLQQQQEFMQGLLKMEYELRMVQQHMGKREFETNRNDDDKDEEYIEREMREIRAAVERDPNNPELRTKMGYVLWEVGEFHAAFEQFKIALSIDPDFRPAFEALEKLREEFPDMSREMRERERDLTREPEQDWNREPEQERERPVAHDAGTVVSANREEVKLLTAAGETITFRVPFKRGEDNSRMVDKELAHLVGSLKPDARVEVWWEEVEGRRFIRRIHQLEEEK
jgi:tetratricopeptide (TPR) repeat protein